MKIIEFLAAWVVVQLIVIGIAGGDYYSNLEANCKDDKPNNQSHFGNYVISTAFPLIWFMPQDGLCEKYYPSSN